MTPLFECLDFNKTLQMGAGRERKLFTDSVSFCIRASDGLVGIEGRSGSGKTTLLKSLVGLDLDVEGLLRFEGKELQRTAAAISSFRSEDAGYVAQDLLLLEDETAFDNACLGLRRNALARKRAEECLDTLQLWNMRDFPLKELSGGERQRVAICRALMNEPELILADEPTGNLDSRSGQIVIDALGKISKQLGKTILMVTHDPKMASFCGRILLLKDGVILKELKAGEDKDAFYREITGQMECL